VAVGDAPKWAAAQNNAAVQGADATGRSEAFISHPLPSATVIEVAQRSWAGGRVGRIEGGAHRGMYCQVEEDASHTGFHIWVPNAILTRVHRKGGISGRTPPTTSTTGSLRSSRRCAGCNDQERHVPLGLKETWEHLCDPSLAHEVPPTLGDATGRERQSMKAFVWEKYGPPETLRMAEVENPAPEADEVLVKVLAISVNPADWHSMRGKPVFSRATLVAWRLRSLGASDRQEVVYGATACRRVIPMSSKRATMSRRKVS
jgi:hypothetical protein